MTRRMLFSSLATLPLVGRLAIAKSATPVPTSCGATYGPVVLEGDDPVALALEAVAITVNSFSEEIRPHLRWRMGECFRAELFLRGKLISEWKRYDSPGIDAPEPDSITIAGVKGKVLGREQIEPDTAMLIAEPTWGGYFYPRELRVTNSIMRLAGERQNAVRQPRTTALSRIEG